jgi:hypothetical protein
MRHTPEAGAVCGNPARTDLRGGQGVTSVPTATKIHSALIVFPDRKSSAQHGVSRALPRSKRVSVMEVNQWPRRFQRPSIRAIGRGAGCMHLHRAGVVPTTPW